MLTHLKTHIFLPEQTLELKISPVDVVSVNRDGKWINGRRDQQFSILSKKVASFNRLSHCIREIQHSGLVVNGQTAGLGQILVNDCRLQRSCHGRLVDLSTFPESSPIGEEHGSIAGCNDDGPRSFHSCDVNDVGSINVHRVDGTVSRIGPINPFVNPVIGDSFRVYSLLDDGRVVLGV